MVAPLIVSPEKEAFAPASIWNTWPKPPPLIVTPAAGPVIVSCEVVSLNSSHAAKGAAVVVLLPLSV
jgi:hypothetical protein